MKDGHIEFNMQRKQYVTVSSLCDLPFFGRLTPFFFFFQSLLDFFLTITWAFKNFVILHFF